MENRPREEGNKIMNGGSQCSRRKQKSLATGRREQGLEEGRFKANPLRECANFGNATTHTHSPR